MPHNFKIYIHIHFYCRCSAVMGDSLLTEKCNVNIKILNLTQYLSHFLQHSVTILNNYKYYWLLKFELIWCLTFLLGWKALVIIFPYLFFDFFHSFFKIILFLLLLLLFLVHFKPLLDLIKRRPLNFHRHSQVSLICSIIFSMLRKSFLRTTEDQIIWNIP